MATGDFQPRYQPCYLLRVNGIPSVVWFEDAIAHYGVPTVVFDLYVLVPDIDTAAQVLIKSGWSPVQQEHGRIGNATVRHTQCRLTPPPQGDETEISSPLSITPRPPRPTTTVLLPAMDWYFNLEGYREANMGSSFINIYPPLADLVDALIDSLLDCPSDNFMLQRYLSCQICYLYGHAPELQQRAFAEHLIYEHRQYHFDVLSGMSNGTVPFISHQRNVREALRQRTRELQECSARDNKGLFPDKEWEARLLASMPDPFAGAQKEQDEENS